MLHFFSGMSLYALILVCRCTLYFPVRKFVCHHRRQYVDAYAQTVEYTLRYRAQTTVVFPLVAMLTFYMTVRKWEQENYKMSCLVKNRLRPALLIMLQTRLPSSNLPVFVNY